MGILLVTLTGCAYFLAQGIGHWVASTYLGKSGEWVATGNVVYERSSFDPTAILRRNIFDSESGPMDQAPLPPEVEPEAPETLVEAAPLDPNAPLPRCTDTLTLVGVFHNVRHPQWSFVSIKETDQAKVYRQGMTVGSKEVLEVKPHSVVLNDSAQPCELAMFAVEEPEVATTTGIATPEVTRAVRPATPEKGGLSDEAMEQGIRKSGDGNYTVARSLVDSLLENQAALMRSARVSPQTENGRTVGVRLYNIRRNSILDRLGVKNGDMLRTINGYDMTSPDGALEAYTRLRSASHLTMSLVRNGKATTLDYRIQ